MMNEDDVMCTIAGDCVDEALRFCPGRYVAIYTDIYLLVYESRCSLLSMLRLAGVGIAEPG